MRLSGRSGLLRPAGFSQHSSPMMPWTTSLDRWMASTHRAVVLRRPAPLKLEVDCHPDFPWPRDNSLIDTCQHSREAA